MTTKIKLLMVDNYDSFTFNIVQYFGELGAEVEVFRNDEITLEGIAARKPDRLVISPGPCSPAEAGVSVAAIQHFAGKLPMWLAPVQAVVTTIVSDADDYAGQVLAKLKAAASFSPSQDPTRLTRPETAVIAPFARS